MLVAPNAEIKLISDQFSFTEGPAVDRKGNVYFTDQPNNKIWKFDTNGNLSLFLDSAGRSNGLYISEKGDIIACADENNELWAISPDKKIKVLSSGYKGKKFNGPNDLWIAPWRGIYFTDPYYQRNYWTGTEPDLKSENVYYLAPGSSDAVIATGNFKRPNGIVGSPDGKTLYVADIQAGKILRFKIDDNHQLTERTEFAPHGADGITLDKNGNLYLAEKGIHVYDSSGKYLGNIPVEGKKVSNLCFAGEDRKTLFITASSCIYTLRMNVAGVE